jgi:hypothetical protein
MVGLIEPHRGRKIERKEDTGRRNHKSRKVGDL